MKLLDSNKKCRIEFGHCRILNSYETLSFQFARYWLGGKYNWFCQPVDYSRSEDALYVRKIIPVRSWGLFCDSFVIVFFQMLHVGYAYYLSKFVDFIDTFCFVARKKFSHVRWAWQQDPIQYSIELSVGSPNKIAVFFMSFITAFCPCHAGQAPAGSLEATLASSQCSTPSCTWSCTRTTWLLPWDRNIR